MTTRCLTVIGGVVVVSRDVNEARSGRGRGQQHEAKAEVKIV